MFARVVELHGEILCQLLVTSLQRHFDHYRLNRISITQLDRYYFLWLYKYLESLRWTRLIPSAHLLLVERTRTFDVVVQLRSTLVHLDLHPAQRTFSRFLQPFGQIRLLESMTAGDGDRRAQEFETYGAGAVEAKPLKIVVIILGWVHVIVKDRSKNISGINHLFKVDLYVMSAKGWIL